jgi:NAD(P)-dependent dehydrogenase (short-subunit alcohol dehydrogenase family)
MSQDLVNQTVVVIGGSNGLGAAVAALAQKHGARVVALSRSGTAPAKVESIAADVSDVKTLRKAFESIGAVDHLVHTAGARTASPALAQIEEQVLTLTFGAKLFGAINAIQAALPYLSERASITLTSGQVSRIYGTGTFVKGAVNSAVDAVGQHLAKELAPRRVNVVSPGIVDTSLWGETGSEGRAAVMARASSVLPVKRAGTPAELAAAYLFAMTNGFVTGAVLDVNGGGLL